MSLLSFVVGFGGGFALICLGLFGADAAFVGRCSAGDFTIFCWFRRTRRLCF